MEGNDHDPGMTSASASKQRDTSINDAVEVHRISSVGGIVPPTVRQDGRISSCD